MKTILLFGLMLHIFLNGLGQPQNIGFSHMVSCRQNAPKTIQELQNGVVIDAYDFYDGDEKALNLLGFLNVDIKKQERITVIEYLQRGSVFCDNKTKQFGIGARLMMRVISHTRKARLDTPQQITASVIFGQATVKFSMHTLGITGPGVAHLNMSGSVTENTYSSFIAGISNLLKEAYNGTEHFIICPQPL
ncbi:MAG: hypothetical protein ACFB0A_04395 [Croceivirga sp.]